MKVSYIGVMNSIGKPDNGFTKAMRTIGDYNEVADLRQITDTDLLFIQTQDTGLQVSELKRLRDQGAFIINWTGDARDTTPKYCFEYAPYVNLTCFSNMRDVDNMRNFGFQSEFLQIGYDPKIYYPDPSIKKDIDIVFMGNNFGHFPLSGLRKQMVYELKQVYGDYFKAYGIGQPDGNFMGDQKGEADIYRRAKIGINLSHYDLPRYTSDRMFRMLGSGVCVLSHDYKGIGTDFDAYSVIYWKDIKKLIDMINYLLISIPFSLLTARIGHDLAISNYTFEHMAQNIVKLWKDLV